MTRSDEPRDHVPEEDVLRDLFARTAAPLSDHAARRLEAAARSIPANRAHRPLFGWLASAAALAAVVLIAVSLWPPETPQPSEGGGPAVALGVDVRSDLRPDIPDRVATLSEEQSEGWEASLDPFGEIEGPSFVGSIGLAHGVGDPSELDLWVQAADAILMEVDEI